MSATESLPSNPLTQGLSKIARGIAVAHTKSRYLLWLSNGIGLELDWVIEGGMRISEAIHYQRVLSSGALAADAMLHYIPPVH